MRHGRVVSEPLSRTGAIRISGSYVVSSGCRDEGRSALWPDEGTSSRRRLTAEIRSPEIFRATISMSGAAESVLMPREVLP